MAIVKCTECSKSVSTKSEKCLGCGAPVSTNSKLWRLNSLEKRILLSLSIMGFLGLFFLTSTNREAITSSAKQVGQNVQKATAGPLSQEGKDALFSLQKLNSRLEVGINKPDYTKEVAEVKFSIEKFEQTDDAKRRTEFTNHLASALTGHLLALEFWDKCSSSEDSYNCNTESESLAAVFQQYPDIQANQNLSFSMTLGSTPIQYWSTDDVLSEIWRHVDADADKAAEEVEKN